MLRKVALAACSLSLLATVAAAPGAAAARACGAGKAKAPNGAIRKHMVTIDSGRVRCRLARRIARSYLRREGKLHQGDGLADSYFTHRKWRKWRCGIEQQGMFGCWKGKRAFSAQEAAGATASALGPDRLPIPADGWYEISAAVDGNYVELGADATMSIRPRRLLVGWPEGTVHYRKLRWKRWGKPTAVGRGQVRYCSDDAGCGKWHRAKRIRLTARHTFDCHNPRGATVRAYTNVSVHTIPTERTLIILGHPAYRPENC
jgi:hypothetical protein